MSPLSDSPEAFYHSVVVLLAVAAFVALVGGAKVLARRRAAVWRPAGRPVELRGARAAAAGAALCLVSLALAGLAVLAWRNS